MKNNRILFLLHLPPPVHGSSMVGKWINESELVNGSFDCRYINLLASKSVNELTTATKKEVDYEEKSTIAQQKLNKAIYESEIAKKRLEKQTIQTNSAQLRYEQL